MKKIFGLFLTFWAVLLVLNGPAGADDPRLVGTFGDWASYVFTENGNKVCYMASKPVKAEGEYSKRGDIYALVTHRPTEGTRDVFSYITGYTYKSGSDVEVEVNNDKFVLFTQDDTAWTPDASTDARLAEALKAGSDMVVNGMSSRGTVTKDTFSLKGSTAAYDKITQECR